MLRATKKPDCLGTYDIWGYEKISREHREGRFVKKTDVSLFSVGRFGSGLGTRGGENHSNSRPRQLPWTQRRL
jgi:hypothetical protein